MTVREQSLLFRGVAAGVVMGLAIGLIAAMFIVARPGLFGALLS
jgi:tetrahydromethanopterin S-methyltransferase subunit F